MTIMIKNMNDIAKEKWKAKLEAHYNVVVPLL